MRVDTSPGRGGKDPLQQLKQEGSVVVDKDLTAVELTLSLEKGDGRRVRIERLDGSKIEPGIISQEATPVRVSIIR